MESAMTKTALVIDGDIFLWECCLSAEEPFDWGDDLWTLHADAHQARIKLDIAFADLKEELNSSTIAIAFSSSENWRKDVLPSYKSHRKKTRKPTVFFEMKEYVRSTYKTFEIPTLEADDVCGILMTTSRLWKPSFDKVVVSTDKDLLQIPGLHYNPNRPEESISEVSKEDGDYNHLFQALTGDAVDGYSGCPRIGPKTAERLLKPAPVWDTVLKAYEDAGMAVEDALQQARVARILRAEDYDFNNKEVRLWEPK